MSTASLTLWKICASLGLPGVALLIFYLLFKGFGWKFPQVKQSWVGPIVILFILVVAGVVLFALDRFGPHGQPEQRPLSLYEGHYQCTADGHTLEACAISRTPDGRYILSFLGPDHIDNELEDRYEGAVITSGDGIVVTLRNQFTANPGDESPQYTGSVIELMTRGNRAQGQWRFANGIALNFEMNRTSHE